ncbi:MAG: glycosyltransferase family 4 protein [Bdellovibrionota bacterium]
MNILFVHRVSDRSEASLLEWMCRNGDHVTVISDPCEPRIHSFEAAGAHVIPMRIKHRLDVKAMCLIRKVCRHKPIDIVYSSFNAGLSTTLFAVRGLPTKVVGYRGTLGNLSRWDPASYLTHLNSRLSGVISNCPPVEEFLYSLGIPKKRLTTIFKGHDAAWYETKTVPSKESLKIPDGHLVVGVVANIRPLKGIDSLLIAMAPLFQEFPVTLLLVGDDRKEATATRIQELRLEDNVRLLGFRKDAAQIATLFDIACMPSTRREGVPRSIVEAMSHGKPAVVTSVGGLPYIVQDKENGLVVPPNDPEALRGALRTLLASESLRTSYGVHSKNRFHEMFKLEQYHIKMREFFETVPR